MDNFFMPTNLSLFVIGYSLIGTAITIFLSFSVMQFPSAGYTPADETDRPYH